MSQSAKRESLVRIHGRYQRAGRPHKKRILDEFCATCGYHRKAALRLLNRPLPTAPPRRSGPKIKYDPAEVLPVLKIVWLASDQLCSKLLKAALPEWLAHHERCSAPLPEAFNPNSEVEWRQASLPDIEGGILAARKERRSAKEIRGFSVRLLRAGGFFRRAGKPGSTAGKDACRHGSASEFGFKEKLLGISPAQIDRILRPARVRQLFGHERFGHPELVVLMNDLYAKEWSQFTNHFKPTFKPLSREKKDGKTKRIYEKTPQTPYQRLLGSAAIPETTKAKLRAEHFGATGS